MIKLLFVVVIAIIVIIIIIRSIFDYDVTSNVFNIVDIVIIDNATMISGAHLRQSRAQAVDLILR